MLLAGFGALAALVALADGRAFAMEAVFLGAAMALASRLGVFPVVLFFVIAIYYPPFHTAVADVVLLWVIHNPVAGPKLERDGAEEYKERCSVRFHSVLIIAY